MQTLLQLTPESLNSIRDTYREFQSNKNTPVLNIVAECLRLIDEEVDFANVGIRHFTLFGIVQSLLSKIDETDLAKLIISQEFKYLAIKYFSPLLTDKVFWAQVADNYIMHNPKLGPIPDELIDLFKTQRPYRRYLMSKEERKFLKDLPEFITIYRGMSDEEYETYDYRISWTLDKHVAEKFANEFYPYSGRVLSIEIPKKHVVAYFNSRNEQEIIYFYY